MLKICLRVSINMPKSIKARNFKNRILTTIHFRQIWISLQTGLSKTTPRTKTNWSFTMFHSWKMKRLRSTSWIKWLRDAWKSKKEMNYTVSRSIDNTIIMDYTILWADQIIIWDHNADRLTQKDKLFCNRAAKCKVTIVLVRTFKMLWKTSSWQECKINRHVVRLILLKMHLEIDIRILTQ